MNIVHKVQTNVQSKNNENKKKMKKAESATNQRAVKSYRAQTVNHYFNITDWEHVQLICSSPYE